MLLVFANRFELIELLGSGPISGMVELGVFEGEFAAHCREALAPRSYTLIDHWDYAQYHFVLESAPQNREIRAVFSNYFRGDPKQILEAAYAKVVQRFAADPAVEIWRMDIADAAARYADGAADIIYLDGSHTYEYVLRDLHLWYPKLAPGGLFICNDFYESPEAARQNLGVIPAVLTFAKRHQIYPVALTAGHWSDLYFSNQPASGLIDRLHEGVQSKSLNAVRLPCELLASYRHEFRTVSSGAQWYLASFCGKP